MLLVSNELSIHLGLGKGFEAPAFSKYPKSENKVISSQILLSFLGGHQECRGGYGLQTR